MLFLEGLFQPQPAYSERLTRRDTILRPFVQAIYIYHSFVPSSIAAWNTLDEVQVCTSDLHSFKHMLIQT